MLTRSNLKKSITRLQGATKTRLQSRKTKQQNKRLQSKKQNKRRQNKRRQKGGSK